MKKKLLLFLIVLSAVFSITAMSQTTRIQGKVTSSEDGLPIAGVSVVVSNTTVGAVTDAQGIYSFNVPSTAKTLRFSFIGFKSVEVTINDQTTIDVILEPEIKAINEVVVTALGIKRDAKALRIHRSECKQ